MSRILLFVIGVRFDIAPLSGYIQILDPVFLKDHLFQSVFYLNSQPPLFNLFLGIILKVFPHHYSFVFQFIYLLMGLALAVSLFLLMRLLGVSLKLSTLLTFLYLINPAVIYYENWLFYSYPVAVMLCLSTILLFFYMTFFRFWLGILFFSSLALLALTRSTFHLLWFLFLVLAITGMRWDDRKKIILAALLPLLLVFSVYLKNFYLFGNFTLSSSILRIQMLEMTMRYTPRDHLDRLYKAGKISQYAMERLQSQEMPENRDSAVYNIGKRRVPVLDIAHNPSSHQVNFNSLAYLNYSKDAMKDAFTAFRTYPNSYFISMLKSYFYSFFPGPTDVSFPNRKILAIYEDLYNIPFIYLNRINAQRLYDFHLFYDFEFFSIKWDALSIIIMACLIAFYIKLVFFGYHHLFDLWTQRDQNKARLITFFFVYFNILYLTFVHNSFTYWSNNRYRFSIDAFLLLLLGLLVTQCIQRKGTPIEDAN